VVKIVDEMTRTRATAPLLKDLNERTVMEAIRFGAPISRAEISRRAGISKPTVSQALQALLEAGLVRETEPDPGRPTYGAVYFEPVAEAALVLGFDLGARFLRCAVCDLRGRVRARQDVEIAGADAALEALDGVRDALLGAAGLAPELVDAIVFGVPGVVDDGTVRLADNVRGLTGRAFAGELAARLGQPVAVENDINLAALGEQWQGVARGVSNFAFLSVGTGLGAGIVVDGELRRGHNGAAGELDYVRAGDDSNNPDAASVSAIAAALAGSHPTRLVAPYDVRAIFAAARTGDELARAVVAEEARRIALHIAPLAAVADVELVVLGGGVGSNGDLLLDEIRPLLERWLAYPPRVEVSSLGDAAVLTGALAVGVRSALDSVLAKRRAAPV
jgi:predicted NBD/HSP70 family sugar kinase/DNA-binding CsgD family transcriptional regulator